MCYCPHYQTYLILRYSKASINLISLTSIYYKWNSLNTLVITAIIGAALSGCGKKTNDQPATATPSTWNTDAKTYSTTNTTVSVNSLIANDYTNSASITLSFSTLPTAQGEYTVTAPGMLEAGKVSVQVNPTKEISIDNGGTVFIFIKNGKIQANFSGLKLGYVSVISLGNPADNKYTVTNHVTGFLYQN
jgi:hypothetical protein